jgi:hypothetical protein
MFFEPTDITAHPEYGLVDPHGGQHLFRVPVRYKR